MKIHDIIKESTTSAGIAGFAIPMGTISRKPRKKKPVDENQPESHAVPEEPHRSIPTLYRSWEMEKLQNEMMKARNQGRSTWKDMQAELNRRAENARFGPGGTRG